MKRDRFYMHVALRIALALAMAGTAGRATADTAESRAWPATSALGRDIPAHPGEDASDASAPPAPLSPGPQQGLTLRRALELALWNSPELAAAACAVRAAEGNARQAGVLPNPELEVEAEEFAGAGARKGYDAAETTLRLSQRLELGGKRRTRQRLAQAEARLAGWEYEATRLDVLTATRKAFIDVLLAQGQLALSGTLLEAAQDAGRAATERARAGKVPMLEETKAGIETANARLARDRARLELLTARERLAASWGGTADAFGEAAGDLDGENDIPPLGELSPLLDATPDVAQGAEETARARETLALAETARIPDVSLSAGISRFEEDGTHAGTVGLSLPLPLFDRNAGGLAAAKHELARVTHEQRAARQRAAIGLSEAHRRLEAARAEALTTRTELLPGAQQAFDAAQTGYREGKFGYLEVLDSQRTLSEAKSRYLDVLAAYQKAAADVERLTGTPLNTNQRAE